MHTVISQMSIEPTHDYTIQSKYQNGRLKEQSNYSINRKLNNLVIREHKTWNPSGQLLVHEFYHKCNQSDEYRAGEFKSYHYNGQLSVHCFYNQGKLDGISNYYYTTGKLWFTYNYKNGDLCGDRIWYYQTGAIQQILKHRNTYSSDICRWYSNGMISKRYQSSRCDINRLWGQDPHKLHDVEVVTGMQKYWVEDGTLMVWEYMCNNRVIATITLKIYMSLLWGKHRLKRYTRNRLRQSYLDNHLIPDLGNIVMTYYYKQIDSQIDRKRILDTIRVIASTML
jgi:hypothetical protein